METQFLRAFFVFRGYRAIVHQNAPDPFSEAAGVHNCAKGCKPRRKLPLILGARLPIKCEKAQ
jgi:hypothetical protein